MGRVQEIMVSSSILLSLTFNVINHKQKQLEGILDSIESRDCKQISHRQNISNVNILKIQSSYCFSVNSLSTIKNQKILHKNQTYWFI